MIPENNSDLEILIYSDFLIDVNQQELSDWIKEEIHVTQYNDYIDCLCNPGVGCLSGTRVGNDTFNFGCNIAEYSICKLIYPTEGAPHFVGATT